MPAQLRISTIDSFCRELALQQPLLSGLGGGLDITENPGELYHRAARRTLEQIGNPDSDLRARAESRDRGAAVVARQRLAGDGNTAGGHAGTARPLDAGFLFSARAAIGMRCAKNWSGRLRARVAEALAELEQLLDQETRDEAMDLARFACGQRNKWLQCRLFQIAGLPCEPFAESRNAAGAGAAGISLPGGFAADQGRHSAQVRDRLM